MIKQLGLTLLDHQATIKQLGLTLLDDQATIKQIGLLTLKILHNLSLSLVYSIQ